jgi:hypothetical protein
MPSDNFSAVTPSGLTNGNGKLIAAIASPGDVIHTCDTTLRDEVYIWVCNLSTITVDFYLEVGNLVYTHPIPNDGDLHLIRPGTRHTGGTVIRAYAETTNVLVVDAIVNRISPA